MEKLETARPTIATREEWLGGLSAIAQRDVEVFHTYSCYSRGIDVFNSAYQLLDLTPKGRDEDGLDWTMQWLHRHAAYPDPV